MKPTLADRAACVTAELDNLARQNQLFAAFADQHCALVAERTAALRADLDAGRLTTAEVDRRRTDLAARGAILAQSMAAWHAYFAPALVAVRALATDVADDTYAGLMARVKASDHGNP